MSPAVPHNIAADLPNDSLSLLVNEDGIIRCNMTPYTARGLLGLPFEQGLLELLPEEEGDGKPMSFDGTDRWKNEGGRGFG
jgi:hypothetical protein